MTGVIRWGLLAGLVLATGCGPAGRLGATAGESPSRAPKVLTVALQQEPAILNGDLAQANLGGGGAHLVFDMVHNYLLTVDERDIAHPQLATDRPSVESGTWRVHPDGRMDLTWMIHPNVKWHDGTPFTTEDLVFSFDVYRDPAVPNNLGSVVGMMESVEALAPHTLVARWSRTYVGAADAQGLSGGPPGLVPLPRHLLWESYQKDRANLAASPRLAAEFVGLGPYRLVRWESGSHMELERFDEYFRGRPPLDRVVVRFIGEANTIIANILSGAVDVVPPVGLDLDATLEVKRQWEGTGNQAIPHLKGGFRDLEIQHRPEYARPRNGLTNRVVRQALYHAIDRVALTQAVTYGLAPPADSWLVPGDPLRAQLEPFIPQFAHDPQRAQQLLADAGWLRGPDGILVHSQTGDVFDVQVTARGPADGKEQSIIADHWKSIGAQVTFDRVPPALQRDRQHASTLPGVWLATLNATHLITDRLHSQAVTSAANRWTGANRGGYSNPRVDGLLDQLAVTIRQQERTALYGDLLREQMGDVPVMMLYSRVDVVLFVKGVRGVKGGTHATWNMFEWDRE